MKIRRTHFVLVSTLLFVGLSLPVHAKRSICLIDLPELSAQKIKIPLGCELVDCCPGCPAEGPLDWRVTLGGAAVAGATVTLESGQPRHLRPGRTRLAALAESGQPRSEAEGEAGDQAPIATLTLDIDEPVVERWTREAKAGSGAGTREPIELRVEQLIGDYVVADYRYAWSIIHCGQPEPCDRIVQTGNTDGDESVIQLDGRRTAGAGGCYDDHIARASGTEAYGNLLANDGCASDLAIYSSQNAVTFQKDASPWTDSCGDTATVPLDPLLEAPTHFWIAIRSGGNGAWWDQLASEWWGSAAPLDVAQEDLLHAAQLYDVNKAGIAFDPVYKQLTDEEWKTVANEVFTLPFLLKLIFSGGLSSMVCAIPEDLETLGFYKKGVLNVYYLPLPFTGMNCSDDPNAIFVGLIKKPTTLAHEFGHAFSLTPPLGHSNGVPGIDLTNVMWVKHSAPRTHFSLGQAFRMSLGKLSVLNLNGVRSGDTRSCPTNGNDATCPGLGLDWTRP